MSQLPQSSKELTQEQARLILKSLESKLMKCIHTFKILLLCAIALATVVIPAHGQHFSTTLEAQVGHLAAGSDSTSIMNLINVQENLWNAKPNLTYFKDMASIANVLIGGSNAQIYWLGRKAIWNMLVKHSPNEYHAAREVRFLKETILSQGAEDITPYVLSVKPEVFASIRHDTFLMLDEYARQVGSTMIPGYHYKLAWTKDPDKQNAIDNETQSQAREASVWLAQDQENYLIDAYSIAPRDDAELKSLLDILNVQGQDRKTIVQRVQETKGG